MGEINKSYKMSRGIVICDGRNSIVTFEQLSHITQTSFAIYLDTHYFYKNCGICETLGLSRNGTIHFGKEIFKWYFKAALDATISMFVIMKSKDSGKDIAILISKAIWETRNDLTWVK